MAETYTNLEIALLAELDADPCLVAFGAQEWTNPTDHPNMLSRSECFGAVTYILLTNTLSAFYRKLTGTVEAAFYKQFMDSGSPGPR